MRPKPLIAVIAIPSGLAFKDTFRASDAIFAPVIPDATNLNKLATFASPPIFENANPTASDVSDPINICVNSLLRVNHSQTDFNAPATSTATGANVSPATSARSPQAFAACLSLPVVLSASAFACAKPSFIAFSAMAYFSVSDLHLERAGIISFSLSVFPWTTVAAARTASFSPMPKTLDSPIAPFMHKSICSDVTPIAVAVDCNASTSSSP